MKTPPKAGAKEAAPKVVKPAGPGAIAAGGSLAGPGASTPAAVDDGKPAEVEVYSATGIDNAIDLLGVVTAKMDKASVGSQAANIERHPEVRSGSAVSCTTSHVLINVQQQRRFKAAFEAYKEREMPKARQDVRPSILTARHRTNVVLDIYSTLDCACSSTM